MTSPKTLTERAMLVSVAITKFGNRKHEQVVSDDIAAKHEAKKDAGRYNKRLLSKEATKAVNAAAVKARVFHYENTLPWLDNGQRILPAANFERYTTEMAKLRAEFDRAVDRFMSDYPDAREAARQELGKLYNEKDYPSPAKMRAKFGMDVAFLPMPDAADFRVGLDADKVATIQRDIEQRTQAALRDATRDLWHRVFDAVQDLRDRLARYTVDEEGKVHHPFRDSATLHLRELCALLPRLNIEGDAELEATRERLEKTLAAYDPEDLRADPRDRRAAIAEANSILGALAGYVGDDIQIAA
jgi:hypothetical protein